MDEWFYVEQGLRINIRVLCFTFSTLQHLQRRVQEAGVADVEEAVAAARGGQRQQALARCLLRALFCLEHVGQRGAALHARREAERAWAAGEFVGGWGAAGFLLAAAARELSRGFSRAGENSRCGRENKSLFRSVYSECCRRRRSQLQDFQLLSTGGAQQELGRTVQYWISVRFVVFTP